MSRDALASHVRSFEPVFDENVRVLVLGTVPSPLSREQALNYGNPRNRFWPVMAALWGCELPDGADERRALALAHHVGLWDVLESCTIRGAQDASIRDAVPNDIRPLLAVAPVRAIFTTGATATRFYRRLIEPVCAMPCTGLPSTSPANAAWSFECLVEAYRPIIETAEG